MIIPVFFLFFSFILPSSCDCPTDWKQGPTGLCYKPFNQNLVWYNAEATCYQNGGHLASIQDAFTNSYLAGLAQQAFSLDTFWLGATTNFLGNAWAWSDFQGFTYTNWASGTNDKNLGDLKIGRLAQKI